MPIPSYFDPQSNTQTYAWDSTRKHLDVARALSERPDLAELRRAPALSRAQVELAHDPRYVTAVETGENRALAQTNGFDWCPQVGPAARAAGGQLLGAARAALGEPLGIAGAVASGFHHAEYSYGMGFCTYNALVITARELHAQGLADRTVILDLDQHLGNGQDELIDRLRLHSQLRHLGIPGAASSARYFTKLEEHLEELGREAERGAALVLYQAGMDPHEDDLLGGVPGMTAALLLERDEQVFQRCRELKLPVAFCLAGGYSGHYSGHSSESDQPEDVNPVVALHVATFRAARDVYAPA